MKTLLWLGLGAAAMYYLDPQQGRRRRALAGDQVTKARRLLRERAAGRLGHLGNRARGAAHDIETPAGAHHLGR